MLGDALLIFLLLAVPGWLLAFGFDALLRFGARRRWWRYE